jgi:hypothetical protein
MFSFEVEYGEYRQFQTGTFVPIGLMEAIRTEVLQMKERFWRLSEKGFPLLALFLQGEKVVGSYAIGYSRPTRILPEQV